MTQLLHKDDGRQAIAYTSVKEEHRRPGQAFSSSTIMDQFLVSRFLTAVAKAAQDLTPSKVRKLDVTCTASGMHRNEIPHTHVLTFFFYLSGVEAVGC